MSDAKKYITFEVDFGAGPYDRSVELRDTAFMPSAIARAFDMGKEAAMCHWAKVVLSEKLKRVPSEVEIGVALGRVPRAAAINDGTSGADLAIIEAL